MDNLSFLDEGSKGQASLYIHSPDDTRIIDGLVISRIEERCPLLAWSFESGKSSLAKASIEVMSPESGICFLRYCYTGDCIDGSNAGGSSLLVLCELFKLAIDYECPELRVKVHGYIVNEIELAGSFPQPLEHLVPSIWFIFEKLADQKSLIDAILHYCISCYKYHKLGEDPEFLNLVKENEAFHKSLFKVHTLRHFEITKLLTAAQLDCMDLFKLPGLRVASRRAEVTDHDFHHNLWAEPSCELADRGEVAPSNLVGTPERPTTTPTDDSRPASPVLPVPEPVEAGDWITRMSALALEEDTGTEVDQTLDVQAGPCQQVQQSEKAAGRLTASFNDENNADVEVHAGLENLHNDKAEDQRIAEQSLSVEAAGKRPDQSVAEDESNTADQTAASNPFGDYEIVYNSDSDWSLVSQPK
ncbi:hypothetical protein K490DRAFT_60677 [Saccharata proteae CBS 121410]|uniref:BTB domain-containing protein n=1 Tax=Saccharata proteae CBS 121410 TaxID=1314787 RepID=A0A9P4HLW1_9PEZI|nr:hypothetical protein K490DRAFT_60677 [Saccharata proteae CBS 121410]